MEAFCFKCRGKHELLNPKATFYENGTPVTQGTCSHCGFEKVYKMGRTPEHEGLTPPERKPREPKAKAEGNGKRTKGGTAKTQHAALSTQHSAGGPLVIVESPTKAKTIGKFLGRRYMVRPSVGHIRDLPKSRLGVDVEKDFEPSYIIPIDKRKTVKELKELARMATEIWLATDPDREGEAISWHLTKALEDELNGKPVQRVEFHEITQDAINHAFAHPRQIDENRVDAQQARRILDRLVGYKLSPLVSDKLSRRGLSAGRVQSVALRLVVERERAILAFVPVEFWTIEAELEKIDDSNQKLSIENRSFRARLFKVRGQDPDLKNEAEALGIVKALAGANYVVLNVERKDRNRRPAAPFTTSTMQQEASRKIGFNARRAMAAAQGLYEGVDVGEGNVGLITYMRTDSVNVAEVAQQEARNFIAERYGREFMPDAPPKYTSRAKNAQEAHEAIRPTSVFRTPEAIKAFLEPDQFKLYNLIWQRFVASQMSNAIFDATTVDIDAQVAAGSKTVEQPDIAPQSAVSRSSQPLVSSPLFLFRATGSVIKFPGFLRVYEEGRDEGDKAADDEDEGRDKRLPPLQAHEPLNLIQLLPEQHFTQPPPRYTEASLVKALEEYGIGRPSTYASIMTTIQSRDYVRREGKQLKPTTLGFDVNDLLVGNFSNYIDVGFTAHVEDELDDIETGSRKWQPVLHEFYDPFKQSVTEAATKIEKRERVIEYVGEACPKCGNPLVYRQSRSGKFIGCSTYPKCDYTSPITVPGVHCPKCNTGKLTERKMRKGNRSFWGCTNYPTCDFTTWNRPIAMKAPDGSNGLVVLIGKNKGKVLPSEFEFEFPDNALEITA
jgi:DNA topoisomerase-1